MISEKKQHRLLRDATAPARKIFNAVPLTEPWSIAQVCTELGRTGILPRHEVVSGCLSWLTEAGLVRETTRGHFIREAIRPTAPDVPDEEDDEPMSTQEVSHPTPPSLFERMAALSSDLRQQAERLEATALMLDSIALEVDDELSNSEDTKELQALKATLKGLLS